MTLFRFRVWNGHDGRFWTLTGLEVSELKCQASALV
jgi:hypothetical protein